MAFQHRKLILEVLELISTKGSIDSDGILQTFSSRLQSKKLLPEDLFRCFEAMIRDGLINLEKTTLNPKSTYPIYFIESITPKGHERLNEVKMRT